MRARTIAVLVLLIAYFMDILDTTIVNVALPAIEKELGATPEQLEWIVSGYVLSFAVLLITSGRIGDLFGRKRIFLIGVAGFTLASAAAVFAWNGDSLVVIRFIQGAFAAVLSPQVLSIVQVLFRPKERAAVFGALGGVSGLAAVAGPLIGGVMVSSNAFGIGWRSIFLINVPFGILLVIVGLFYIPESKSPRRTRLDIPGVILATAGIFMLVFALIEGREASWAPWIWILLAASIVVLIIFVFYQRRRDRRDGAALVPLSLFENRGYSAGVVIQFTFAASIGAFFLIFMLYLQLGLGFEPIAAALVTLPFSVGALAGSGISVPLGARLGKFLILFGALAQIGGYIGVFVVVAQEGNSLEGVHLIFPMAFAGMGLTLEAIPLTDVALAKMPLKNAGAASGVFGTMQQLGSVIGVAVIGVVFFGVISNMFTPEGIRNGFLSAVWVSIIALAISAIATFFLPGIAAVRQNKIDSGAQMEADEAAATVEDSTTIPAVSAGEATGIPELLAK